MTPTPPDAANQIVNLIDGVIPDVDSRERSELAAVVTRYVTDLHEQIASLRDNNESVKAMFDQARADAALAERPPVAAPMRCKHCGDLCVVDECFACWRTGPRLPDAASVPASPPTREDDQWEAKTAPAVSPDLEDK